MTRIATAALLDLHVSIRYKTRVISSSSESEEGVTITLSNEERLSADMYIPAFGLTANSSYIPSKFLNENGFVVVDQHLHVKGADDVWAIGDVSALERKQYLACRAQAIYLSGLSPDRDFFL
jgi:NADH dehydrogenase FAD-containing subunit